MVFITGGLIFHYFHNPIQLEITQDYNNFVGVDDSETKLSIKIFLVIFIFLYVGLAIGLIVLLLEIWYYKRMEKKKEMERWANRRPKVAR